MTNDKSNFSIKMSMDDKVCILRITNEEPITYRILIDRLRDLADQIEEDHEHDDGGRFQ